MSLRILSQTNNCRDPFTLQLCDYRLNLNCIAVPTENRKITKHEKKRKRIEVYAVKLTTHIQFHFPHSHTFPHHHHHHLNGCRTQFSMSQAARALTSSSRSSSDCSGDGPLQRLQSPVQLQQIANTNARAKITEITVHYVSNSSRSSDSSNAGLTAGSPSLPADGPTTSSDIEYIDADDAAAAAASAPAGIDDNVNCSSVNTGGHAAVAIVALAAVDDANSSTGDISRQAVVVVADDRSSATATAPATASQTNSGTSSATTSTIATNVATTTTTTEASATLVNGGRVGKSNCARAQNAS